MVSPAAPAISVIVPNYRHAPYLPKRIESILAQTRQDFELLILDDCSPDDSRDVIARYTSDPRVRTEFNSVNSGNTFLQWRKGLSLTTAPYVWVAESDDFSDPHFLERLSAKLDADPAIGLAFCETMTVDADGAIVEPYFEHWRGRVVPGFDLDFLTREFVMPGRDFVRHHMVSANLIPNASAVLFRRSAIDAIGGPVSDMRLCGDWLTYCKILTDHAVAHVPDLMNYFRDHRGNVRTSLYGDVFVRESHKVVRWIQQEMGPPPPDVRAYIRDFYAQAMVNLERGNRAKISPTRIPAALQRTAKFDAALLPLVTAKLLREIASGAATKIGLR